MLPSTLRAALPRRITLPSTFKTGIKLAVRRSDPATLPVSILLWSSPNVQPARVSLSSKRPRSRSTQPSTSPWKSDDQLCKESNRFIKTKKNGVDVWVTKVSCVMLSEKNIFFICQGPDTQTEVCGRSMKVQGAILCTWSCAWPCMTEGMQIRRKLAVDTLSPRRPWWRTWRSYKVFFLLTKVFSAQ